MSPTASPGGILDLLLSAGPVAQFILFVLGGFSVISWAIMVERHRALSRSEKESAAFLEKFRSTSSMSGLIDLAEHLTHSPMAAIFRAGIRQINAMASLSSKDAGGHDQAGGQNPTHRLSNPVSTLERALTRAANEEQSRLERLLPFLATTAAACPFIGLFGTVWGIMNSFHAIGGMGTANLAVVAPGISEALIATAAGLAAAIPAVVGYNYFVNRIRRMASRLDNFVADFLIRAEMTHFS